MQLKTFQHLKDFVNSLTTEQLTDHIVIQDANDEFIGSGYKIEGLIVTPDNNDIADVIDYDCPYLSISVPFCTHI